MLWALERVMSEVKRQSPEDRPEMSTADDRPAEQKREISPENPDSMPRAEDDEKVFEKSPEFHDRPDGATKDHTP